MVNNISIYKINGDIFQEITYNNINELYTKLKLLISYNDSNLYIHLLVFIHSRV